MGEGLQGDSLGIDGPSFLAEAFGQDGKEVQCDTKV